MNVVELVGMELNVNTDDGGSQIMTILDVFTLEGKDYAALMPENGAHIEILQVRRVSEDDCELIPIENEAEFEAARNECANRIQSQSENATDEYGDDDVVCIEIDGIEYRILDIFTVPARKRQYAALTPVAQSDSEVEILLYRYSEYNGSDDPESISMELTPIASDMEYDEVRISYVEQLEATEHEKGDSET